MSYFFILILSTVTFAKSFVPESFSTNFEESLISVATGKEKKSFGKIDYKFPGNIFYEKTSLPVSILVSNSQTSWYYNPPFVKGEKGQVTIQKASKLPLTKFLDSIKNGLEGSKLFTLKYDGNMLTLTFTPAAQKEFTLKEVTLMATKEAKSIQTLGEFQKMSLLHEDGRKVVITFLDFKENAALTKDHFVFKVPEDTKITQ